jgi:hypothetical protein
MDRCVLTRPVASALPPGVRRGLCPAVPAPKTTGLALGMGYAPGPPRPAFLCKASGHSFLSQPNAKRECRAGRHRRSWFRQDLFTSEIELQSTAI